MVTAFVLIKAEAVADLPTVAEVYSVTGEHDIIALLRVSEYESLDETVPSGIARIVGVIGTTTILAFRRFSRRDLEAGYDLGLS